MYIHTSAFQTLLPGEPTPEALHRQEYFEAKDAEADEANHLVEPAMRQRAALLRARIITGVGSYFA